MIPEVTAVALLLASAAAGEARAADPEPAPAPAAEGDEEELETDDTLSRYRTPFAVLAERTLGTTSRSVEFDWRRTDVQVAIAGHHLFELNNFNTLRLGGLVRLPSGGVLFEIGLDHVWVWDTPSSAQLAFTPYRQPGRPSRGDLDLAVALPLAEGVITAWPRFFPATELVFNLYLGLRYSFYPTAFQGMTVGQVATALLSPRLTETEIANLERARLAAMDVDPGRYGLVAGIGDDLYFKQGVFVSPRATFSMPLLAPASGTELVLWVELSLALGIAW